MDVIESTVFLVRSTMEMRQTDVFICVHPQFSKFIAYSIYIMLFLWLSSFKSSPIRLSLKNSLKSSSSTFFASNSMFQHNFVLIQRKVQIQNFINPILIIFLGMKKMDTHGQKIFRDNSSVILI